jgi:DNA adenine methylase
MMRVPQPIPYQGSKRSIAGTLLSFIPRDIEVLVEPFAGSAALTLAAAYSQKASRFHLNDLNEPLMELWREIIYRPENISNSYQKLWTDQVGCERESYDQVREEFNRTKKPEHLLYLLARCVKAAVRYNSQGEFNQSPDNRRKGKRPSRMREEILAASRLLKGKTTVSSQDYRVILEQVQKTHLVYMDPPYQGLSSGKDPRYYERIDSTDFSHQLRSLVDRDISFILSYDGRRGEIQYGQPLPLEMGLYHIEIEIGRSAQSTLLGYDHVTYESIYLSPALVQRLGKHHLQPLYEAAKPAQVSLFSN